MTCFLEHPVKFMLHLLPDGITVWLDHHTASDCRTLSQISLDYEIIIPLRIIIRPFGYLFCHCYFVFIVFLCNIADECAYEKHRFQAV